MTPIWIRELQQHNLKYQQLALSTMNAAYQSQLVSQQCQQAMPRCPCCGGAYPNQLQSPPNQLQSPPNGIF